MAKKELYYTGDKIIKLNADYNIIVGERSNGKTHYFCEYALKQFKKTGKRFVYIRRNMDEFSGSNSARRVFDTLIHKDGTNLISKILGNDIQGIEYYGGLYYTQVFDETTGKLKRTKDVVGYGLVLSHQADYKSTSYNDVTTIIFDEFMTRRGYLFNEFIEFSNLLSTIIRDRNDVKIFMLANTVQQYGCPYFSEMGLKNISRQKQGTIDIYTYGEKTDLKVAVEYCETCKVSKPSNKYFAFDKPQLEMITSGAWEIASYPHCPIKLKPRYIYERVFLIYEDNILECDICLYEGNVFGFWHMKTGDIKDDNAIILYACTNDYRYNHINNILWDNSKVCAKLRRLWAVGRMYYADNLTGEIVYSYLQTCKADKTHI